MKNKFNLVLTPEKVRQLDRLQKRTGAASWAEVIRHALNLYQVIQTNREAWNEVIGRRLDKETTITIV